MTDIDRTYRIKYLAIGVIALEILFFGSTLLIYNEFSAESNNFRLEQPDYAWGLAILPLLSIVYLLWALWKNKAIKSFTNERLTSTLFPVVSTLRSYVRYALVRMGIGLVILSLCNPQYGKTKRAGVKQGIEIMLALDISNSMKAKDDRKYSRLDIAKRAISKLLREELGGDKVGLVIFAGSAYKHTPLTTDYTALMNSVNMVEPFMVSAQGTDISTAIQTSLTSFNEQSTTNKAIIIVSDGENHEEDAVLAAKTAYESKGVKVYTIGMGNPKGATIPMYNQRGEQIGYKKDSEGKTVVTKLNEQNLMSIAQAGGGSYTKAASFDLGLNEIVEDIDRIEKSEYGETPYLDYDDQFHWFLGAGILFLLPSLVLFSDNVSKKRKLQLFEE